MSDIYEKEIWKDIPGFEGHYQASTLGRIKSLDRKDTLGRSLKGRIMKQGETRGKYLTVGLSKNEVRKTYRVNRLILMTFCPCENMEILEANHKNENRQDNRLENLNWLTSQENSVWNDKHKRTGEKNKNKNGKKVICLETGEIFPSLREASRQTGINSGDICRCCQNENFTYFGKHYEYYIEEGE